MLVRSAISIIDSALVNWRKTTHAMFLTHIQYINLHYPTHIHVWQFCIRTIFSTKIQASYGRLSREPLVLWQHRLFPTFTQVCTRTCRHWIRLSSITAVLYCHILKVERVRIMRCCQPLIAPYNPIKRSDLTPVWIWTFAGAYEETIVLSAHASLDISILYWCYY